MEKIFIKLNTLPCYVLAKGDVFYKRIFVEDNKIYLRYISSFERILIEYSWILDIDMEIFSKDILDIKNKFRDYKLEKENG